MDFKNISLKSSCLFKVLFAFKCFSCMFTKRFNQYKHKQVESVAEYQENGIVINPTIRAKYFTIEI